MEACKTKKSKNLTNFKSFYPIFSDTKMLYSKGFISSRGYLSFLRRNQSMNPLTFQSTLSSYVLLCHRTKFNWEKSKYII